MRTQFVTSLLIACLPLAPGALADGGFIYPVGVTTDLAQTRQEVLIAFHGDGASGGPYATYVLGTSYSGTPADFAWIIPVPNTPTDVMAHESDNLFDSLDDVTKPRLTIFGLPAEDRGFGCFGRSGMQTSNSEGGLVTVEASGQAGIFQWSALTSTGSNALLSWLNDNDFNVPSSASDILEAYVQQGMHFLALQISKPTQVQTSASGEIEIPPIQFTCQTSQRFYPMAISRISAAASTEVLIYVLAEHRAETANVANGVIDETDLRYDPGSPSLTNYETLFTQAISDLGGVALITEYAATQWGGSLGLWFWSEAPSGMPNQMFLTRMRTLIARDQMTLDFQFQDASEDELLNPWHEVNAGSYVSAAAAGQALAALVLPGVLLTMLLRWACPWFAKPRSRG